MKTHPSPVAASKSSQNATSPKPAASEATRQALNEWTVELAERMLRDRGYIVDIGQVPPAIIRRLNKAAKEGRLAKKRGHWNAPLGGFGCGPLKTIWLLPELAA